MNLINIDIHSILPSLTNPRKHFPEAYIAELSASIAQRGIITPLMVRSKQGGTYELIAGECRLRAAALALLAEVPCLVNDGLSESEVMELQLVENLQRKDLSLLEEADGYAALLEMPASADGSLRWTVEAIAEKIGKSSDYIRVRLLIRDLGQDGRKAIEEGILGLSVARLLARIPTAALRSKAMREVLKPEFEDEPLSARKAAQWIAEHYMVDLKGVPWKLADAELVPVEIAPDLVRLSGGACKDCPWCSSNAEVSDFQTQGVKLPTRENPVCMHPACYASKVDASWEESRMAALKAGKTVLSQEAAEKVLNPHGPGLRWDTGYVVLADQVPAHELRADVKKAPTWKKLLADVPHPPEIVVVRDHRGRPLELVDRRQAFAALKLASKQSGEELPLRDGGREESSKEIDKERRDKLRERGKVAMETAVGSMDALRDAVVKSGIVEGFWRALFPVACYFAGNDGLWMVCKWLNIEPEKDSGNGQRQYHAAIEKAFAKTSEKDLVSIVLMLLLSRGMKYAAAPGEWSGGSDGYTKELASFAGLYGVDLAGISKAAKAAAKPKKKEKTVEAAAEEFKKLADEGLKSERKASNKKMFPLPDGKIEASMLMEKAQELYRSNNSEFSVAFLQRQLRLGYNAAVTLHDDVIEAAAEVSAPASFDRLPKKLGQVDGLKGIGINIMAELFAGGPEGVKISEIADAVGQPRGNVAVWFSTSGKDRARKVEPGRYSAYPPAGGAK